MVPFFHEGVAGEPSVNQADGIHPTAEAHRIIATTVYAAVREAIVQESTDRPV